MKKYLKSLILIGMALFTMSCQKDHNDGNTVTTAPINGDCMNNPSSCNSQIYQQNYGYSAYNYNQNYYSGNSSYLCSCPAGSMPTYNNYAGLGCVNSSYTSGYGVGAYASFSWGGGYAGATNNQWTNIPQVSNYTGYNNSNTCYNGVAQSCLVDQSYGYAACSAGYTCRSTSAQSRIGLCVSNSAVGNGLYGGQYR